jgi:hypothetical protein
MNLDDIVYKDGKPIGYRARSFHNIPVEVRPDMPPDEIYLINDRYMHFASIDTRTRWQRFRDWLIRKLRRR